MHSTVGEGDEDAMAGGFAHVRREDPVGEYTAGCYEPTAPMLYARFEWVGGGDVAVSVQDEAGIAMIDGVKRVDTVKGVWEYAFLEDGGRLAGAGRILEGKICGGGERKYTQDRSCADAEIGGFGKGNVADGGDWADEAVRKVALRPGRFHVVRLDTA